MLWSIFVTPLPIVTVAKLLRPKDGRLRLFAAGGRVIPSGENVRGSVATVRPDASAAAFLSAMMRQGVEHHLALVYGDWKRELELFCEFTGMDYVTFHRFAYDERDADDRARGNRRPEQ